MKVAVLGDVGQPVYHVGDEAMTHAAVDALRARGFDDVVVLSRDVAQSRIAFDADAASTLAFPWPPEERSDYLRRVLGVVQSEDAEDLPASDPAWDFADVLRRCDALLVAGGGNMNSLYGWLLYERVAAVKMARALGLRVVVSGQTLGPDLHGPDRDAARQLVEGADLIGAREARSLRLMEDLAPDSSAARPCLDDASFMDRAPAVGQDADEEPVAEQYAGAADLPRAPYIAVTFSPNHGESERETYLGALAVVLDHMSELTGHSIVFVPHMATPCQGNTLVPVRGDTQRALDVDELVHHDIAARMRSRDTVLLPVLGARETAAITRGAALVITSRYHPVVFALEGGTPVIALAPDDYSYVRMEGALENWGLGNLALTLPALFDGTLAVATADVWKRRTGLSSYLDAVKPAQLARHDQWWDDVGSALRGQSVAPASPTPLDIESIQDVVRPTFEAGWQEEAAVSTRFFLPMASALTATRIELEHVRGQLDVCRRDRDRARQELTAWWNSKSFKLARRISATISIVRRKR